MAIQIDMTGEDFGYLIQNGAKWASERINWQEHISDGRFETAVRGDVPLTTWKNAYWLGGSYAAVILARAFLAAHGEGCQVLIDAASDGEWVILTDYELWKQED